MISGDRVRQIRELRGYTQTELARRVGVRQSAIAQVESGLLVPSEATLHAIALQLGFPLTFFQQGPAPEFPLGSLMFRALRSTSARDRAQARRYGETVYEAAMRLADHVTEAHSGDLPQMKDAVPPVRAAEVTRATLGMSRDDPISHVINVIERAGVLVLGLPVALKKRDAFSAWMTTKEGARRAVIAIAEGVPGDRLRFSAAHELGHVVMHTTIRKGFTDLEREANRFAAELLLPHEALRAEIRSPVTLASLAPLKARWGVSIQTLIIRARDLEAINERQYRYLFEQIGLRGWRTQEPGDIAIEKPRALRKMAELLYGVPIDTKQLASDLKLPLPLVRAILDAYAGKGELPRKPRPNNVVQLRVHRE
jgi:Zn-dependent peptidase ImmA (M78 family)/transcriptional regulator with XRE-family HTH domain